MGIHPRDGKTHQCQKSRPLLLVGSRNPCWAGVPRPGQLGITIFLGRPQPRVHSCPVLSRAPLPGSSLVRSPQGCWKRAKPCRVHRDLHREHLGHSQRLWLIDWLIASSGRFVPNAWLQRLLNKGLLSEANMTPVNNRTVTGTCLWHHLPTNWIVSSCSLSRYFFLSLLISLKGNSPSVLNWNQIDLSQKWRREFIFYARDLPDQVKRMRWKFVLWCTVELSDFLCHPGFWKSVLRLLCFHRNYFHQDNMGFRGFQIWMLTLYSLTICKWTYELWNIKIMFLG